MSKWHSCGILNGLFCLFTLSFIVLTSPELFASERDSEPGKERPSSAYIDGVKYISWAKTGATNYPNKNILNPSWMAAYSMLLDYWGIPYELNGDFSVDESTQKRLDGDSKKLATLEDIKEHVASGIPVWVSPAITPYAHYLYITVKMHGYVTNNPIEQKGPTSGLLGEMVSIDDLMSAVEKGCDAGMINDSVFVASRIVIGYDDNRQVLIMHDPIFGPDWEISYSDFQSMWRLSNASYTFFFVRNAAGELVPDPDKGPRQPRTPDHEATIALFNGYSLAATNQLDKAESELRNGLEIAGISARYKHLLKLELGSLLRETNRPEEAVQALLESTSIYSKHFRAWGELGLTFKCCIKGREARKNESTALKNAKRLCSDNRQIDVARDLGRDFYIMGCKGNNLLGAVRD